MKHVAPLLVAALVLAGCASDSRIERAAPTPLAEFKVEAEVKELWRTHIGLWGDASYLRLVPVLDGDTVYAADARGRVGAFTADSGRRLWKTRLKLDVTGATGVGADLVVVGTEKGDVIALDKATGNEAWRARVSSEVLAPPTAQAGVVVVQTVDGKVFGLSAKDGKRLWSHSRGEPGLSLRGTSAPLIVGEHVLTGFASGKIAVLQLRDGRLLWELPVAQPRGRNEIERLVDVDAAPLVTPDMLFAASYQGKVIAVNVGTGRIVWSRDVSTYNGMDMDRNNIYLSDEHGQVLALDRRSGASVWRQEKLRARMLSAPTVVGGYVAVGDFEGYVHWLAADDGRFVARSKVSDAPILAKAVAGGAGALYVAGQDGVLSALRIGANF